MKTHRKATFRGGKGTYRKPKKGIGTPESLRRIVGNSRVARRVVIVCFVILLAVLRFRWRDQPRDFSTVYVLGGVCVAYLILSAFVDKDAD